MPTSLTDNNDGTSESSPIILHEHVVERQRKSSLDPAKMPLISSKFRSDLVNNRERPSSIDLSTSHFTKEGQHYSPNCNSARDSNTSHTQHSLLSHSFLKKEMKKLSLSRGINLPAIKLNDVLTSDSPAKKGHRRGQSLDHFQSDRQQHDEFGIGENNSSTDAASDISPASIISPIGHTLKHSAEYTREHDLNRTMHSESFCIVGVEQQQQRSAAIEPEAAIDIRIFYANGTAVQFNVENGFEASAQDLLQLMADHLEIDDFSIAEEALAIWLVSPLLEIQLKSHHIPYEIYQKWPAFLRRFTASDEDDIALDEPLLVLRRNVLLTLDREIQFVEKYEQLTQVLYLHARDEYLSGRYPVNIETALDLVGLQLAIEFEPYNGRWEDALNLIYESLHEIAPSPHIRAIRGFHLFGLRMMECKRGLENRVIDEYRTASQHFQNNYERQKEFLTVLRRTPFYGAAFYSGTIDKSKLLESANNAPDEGENASHRNGLESVESQNGDRFRRRQRTLSQTKLKAIVSPVNLLDRLRRLFHYRNGQHVGGHQQNGKSAGRREILIGINHGYITLIDPREHKLLEVLQDSSPEGNMSLNEKISLFCAGD